MHQFNTYHSLTAGRTLRVKSNDTADLAAPWLGIKPESGPQEGIRLSRDDAVSAAIDLLTAAGRADVAGYVLEKTLPHFPMPKVGEFYRVKSNDDMALAWRGNPIVKVVSHPRSKPLLVGQTEHEYFDLQTAGGSISSFSTHPKTHGLLEGPIEVEVTETWTEVQA